jgi:hypothetical protein
MAWHDNWKENCEDLLRELSNDPESFTHGRRNDDCVNALIACKALGIDFYEWLGESDRWIDEHVERIEPYLEDWFQHGPEYAMDFMV